MEGYEMLSQSGTSPTALSVFTVEGLFDRFDYKICFDEDEQTKILISPNGYGKTTILAAIHNFLSANFQFFVRLTFSEMEFHFSNNLGVRITKQLIELTDENSRSISRSVVFEPIGYQDSTLENFEYVGDDHESAHSLSPATTNLWSNPFAAVLATNAPSKPPLPDWLEALTINLSSHLIETQRLLLIDSDKSATTLLGQTRPTSQPAVNEEAADLSKRIHNVVNRYATEAQKLDQTFPKRIIEASNRQVEKEDDIRAKLQELAEKREELVNAGLVGESVGEPISTADDLSDKNIRRILSIYINDTEDKISVFQDIFERVRLFKAIINDHFKFKQIHVNQQDGISAYDTDTSKVLKLSELSSGEQHELVLLYELLFVVDEGAMILIDEPELSLHVAWQKRFINDLREIQQLRKLQFVIATHSPQIISNQWHLVQELSDHE